MEYALGRSVEYYDQPAIRTIVKAAEKDNYPMVSFITGVVKSDAFLMKRAETPVTDTTNSKSVGRN
jgi:hypothetical protein